MEITNKENFHSLIEFTEKTKRDMNASGAALVLIKDNDIVLERYTGTHHFEKGARAIDENSRFNVYSTRVTYVGLALAIAVYEGSIGLDDKLSYYLHEYDKQKLGDVTIRHLVTRCTGLKFDHHNVYHVFDPGTNMEGKRPDLLARILYRATGKTVNEILSNQLFEPLKWINTGWVTEAHSNLVCDINPSLGYPTLRLGSNIGDDRNLYVSARELALWGNLHLHKGEYNGEQMLPKEIFELATTIQSPPSLPSHLPKFGFLWWIQDREVPVENSELGHDLPDGSYQILGASGCSCTVIPEYNAVAVQMYNSVNASKHYGFDYLHSIQSFGDLVVASLKRYIS